MKRLISFYFPFFDNLRCLIMLIKSWLITHIELRWCKCFKSSNCWTGFRQILCTWFLIKINCFFISRKQSLSSRTGSSRCVGTTGAPYVLCHKEKVIVAGGSQRQFSPQRSREEHAPLAMMGKERKSLNCLERDLCFLDTGDWRDDAKTPQSSTLPQTVFLRGWQGDTEWRPWSRDRHLKRKP